MMSCDRRDSLNVLDRAIDGLMEAIGCGGDGEPKPSAGRKPTRKEPRKCRSPRTSRSPS